MFKFYTLSWIAAAAMAWVLSLYGVLQLHRLDGLFGHAICGAWGCGPPVEALLAYHGFWLVLIAPPAALAGQFLSPSVARNFGWALFVVGFLAVLGILFWAAMDWLVSASGSSKAYVVQRSFFVLATMIDLPAVQCCISGFLCWAIACRRIKHTPCDRLPRLGGAVGESRALP